MKKKYKVKSRFRFFISFMIMMFLILSIGGNVVAGSDKHSGNHINCESENIDEYITIVIEHGDSLWNIAKEFGPKGKDTRRIVHKISILNDIRADQLVVGQEIIIPKDFNKF